MKIYIKNMYEQQTIRDIPFFKAIWLRLAVWFKYPLEEERPKVRFLV